MGGDANWLLGSRGAVVESLMVAAGLKVAGIDATKIDGGVVGPWKEPQLNFLPRMTHVMIAAYPLTRIYQKGLPCVSLNSSINKRSPPVSPGRNIELEYEYDSRSTKCRVERRFLSFPGYLFNHTSASLEWAMFKGFHCRKESSMR
jgi:hypothetical protein